MKTRPTSPHLSIYKPQITSILSILHRLTGVGIFVFMLLSMVLFCIGAYKTNAGHDGVAQMLLSIKYAVSANVFLKLLLSIFIFTVSFGLFYHICAGLRYLIWSLNYGLSLKFVTVSAYIILTTSFLSAIFITVYSYLKILC